MQYRLLPSYFPVGCSSPPRNCSINLPEAMIHYSWKKLDCFPLLFVVSFAVAIFVPCIIALRLDHVSPYIPYISEGGGEFPEAGIFSTFTCLSSFLSQWIFLIRYAMVQEMNLTSNDTVVFLNKISVALGGVASVSLIVMASYPASMISQVHNSAAGIACVCLSIYLICHTFISFHLLGGTAISYCRLLITILCTLSLILVSTFGLIGSSQWTADYWAGKKKPDDKGFVSYVVSASSEWIMTGLLIFFFATYISEFKKATLHFQVEVKERNANKSNCSIGNTCHR